MGVVREVRRAGGRVRNGRGMPERSEYAPGTPSWVDLAAPDLDKARSFYATVLGWSYRNEDVGADVPYDIALVGDRTVAGLMPVTGAPGWNTYVAVADLEDAVRRAEDAGGQVAIAPTSTGEDGRMARITDPLGASVGLWEAGTVAGAELVNEPGALIWNELICGDLDTAARFYGDLFGWDAAEEPAPGGGRALLFNGESGPVASARDPQSGIGALWLVYFACEDADACTRAITDAGGAIAIAPLDASFGRMGAAVDSNGVPFAFVAADPEYAPAA